MRTECGSSYRCDNRGSSSIRSYIRVAPGATRRRRRASRGGHRCRRASSRDVDPGPRAEFCRVSRPWDRPPARRRRQGPLMRDHGPYSERVTVTLLRLRLAPLRAWAADQTPGRQAIGRGPVHDGAELIRPAGSRDRNLRRARRTFASGPVRPKANQTVRRPRRPRWPAPVERGTSGVVTNPATRSRWRGGLASDPRPRRSSPSLTSAKQAAPIPTSTTVC
jgi:hypothetical protein